MNTLARLEIKIIMIEYELDAFLTHCQNKPGCTCIGPIAKDRLRRTRNVSRGVRDIIRNAQGFTQKTLTNPNTNTWNDKKKRAWGRGLNRNYDCELFNDYSKCSCMHIPHKENCFLFPFQQWKRGGKHVFKRSK